MNRSLTRVAMTTAAIMVAHQVAAKAFRDAAFLRAWPAAALPLMTMATAALTGAVVPLFSGLLARFPPVMVLTVGFAVSAAGHAAEWTFFDGGRTVAVIVYLHLAAVGAVLLSGFWAIVAERYDPAGARASFGRIAAAGTAGGIAGSVAAARLARPDLEDQPHQIRLAEASSRQVEYVFFLLSTIVARVPFDAAVHGVRSPNAGVRGLTIEYLDQVLPAAVLERLRTMLASTSSDGGAPAQSAERSTTR